MPAVYGPAITHSGAAEGTIIHKYYVGEAFAFPTHIGRGVVNENQSTEFCWTFQSRSRNSSRIKIGTK